VGKQSNRKLIVYLPLVLVATFLVVVAPLLLVFWLRRSGTVSSVWTGAVIGVVASFLASYAGGALWKTRPHSRDILFSELMLWGWVQRWRSERRLSAAADLLGLTTGRPQAISGGRLTNDQKAGLLTQLTSGLEARDPYTHGHSRRVARHAANIAKRMGLSRREVAKIRAAGAMHDVGKVETPIAVLHKEGRLNDEEYAIIKRHPVDGAAMVSTLDDHELTAMVRHHHERLDGTGYPDRLAGEAIPIGSRILAVADTFDAITSTRPYRHAHAHKKALDILAADAGTQLDPDAVRAFCDCYSGRRPLAYWTILVNARPRVAALLGGGLGPANAATVGNVVATAATAAAVGSAALSPLVEAPSDSQAIAEVAAAPAPSKTRSRPSPPAPRPSRQPPSDPARPVTSGIRSAQNRGRPQASASTSSEASDPAYSKDVVQSLDSGAGSTIASGNLLVEPMAQAPSGGEVKDRTQARSKPLGKAKGKREAKGKTKAKTKNKSQAKVKGPDKIEVQGPTGKGESQAPAQGQGKDKYKGDPRGPAASP